ncbi:LysR substrate-binding domain-containing protein [Vibrio tapetis subsp. quintayensis]|uniref:LysR family transcriptional regulator n=1 Tax=Vibrio tapetis TaxID=52443 RepID=UPI0025B325F3|nr:LysR family transcriptional regulator [Vibrio tapetis]MDN3682788.1 LysR substrate-binding domain-containing protein [Vibrio tapetis subsp. quintayensis]
MDLDFKSLALFIRVAELGKIGQAGLDFGFSTTNASQRIQHLESQVGVKLFHRTTRTVSLTHDGVVFLEHAKRIIDNIEETRNVFKGDKNIQGKIRIAVSSTYGRLYVVPFIPAFLKQYPDLNIEIDFSDNRLDIVEHGYDVAFRIGNLESNSLLARKVADNPLVLVASPQYLENAASLKTPNDLENHVCIPFMNNNQWEFKSPNGSLHKVSVHGPLSVNWGDAISDLVEVGMGVGLAALWRVAPDITQGKVEVVLKDYEILPKTAIWAVRPPGRFIPARVKVFLDYIEEAIRRTNHERYGSFFDE